MTKTIDGVTYELVANRYPRSDVIDCNCDHCAAIGNRLLCGELGMECIGKGVWKVADTAADTSQVTSTISNN